MNYLRIPLVLAILPVTALCQTTWNEIPVGTDTDLNTIDFPTASVGYIGGDDSLLLKTTDYGATWSAVNFTGVDFVGANDIVQLQFTDASTGYMVAGYSGSYKTTDGGLTWSVFAPPTGLCYFQSVYFTAEDVGFIGGAGCFSGEGISVVTPTGFSEADINEPTWDPSDLVVAIDFLDADFGMAASAGGRILRTTNGGVNWDTISLAGILTTGVPLTSIEIVDDTLAYAGYNDMGSGFGLLRSVDGGLTWAMDMASATFWYPAFHCVHRSGSGKIYSGASNSTAALIFENDEPDYWPAYEVDHAIHSMTTSYGSTVWGVGDSGYVVVNQDPSQLGIESESANENFGMYPNPADDVIHIAPLVNGSEGTVALYDALGHLVIEVPLSPETILNVAHLQAGIYLVRVSDGQSEQLKKLVVR